MKKVSILSLHLGYGGIEKSISALANMLARNYEVEIVCVYKMYDKPIFNIDKNVNIKYLLDDKPNKKEFVEAIKNKKVLSILSEGLKSIKILYERKHKISKYIKICDSDIIVSTRDIFNKWLSKNKRKNTLTVAWEHNHFHGNMNYANKIINSCKKLDYLVVVSENLQKFYSEKLKKTKVIFIPNVLEGIPSVNSSLEEKRLISVGRLSEEKGYMDLLEIYKELLENHSDWKLDLIGDGIEKEKLEKYVLDNNLKNNVKFHGFQDKKYINKMFNKSSIYLMTSHTESFGIVLLEAMSYGIPCIAFSSAEGANEIIENKYNGFLVNNRNKEEYLAKIKLLIEDKKLRERMGSNAKKSVMKYDSNNVKEKWYEILG